MQVYRELGDKASSIPFLSIVTRCFRRPTYLQANVESLKSQTDPDYEQVFLVDEKGVGVGGANRALALAEPRGEYVLVLDDDDMLSDTGAITALKEAVAVDDPHLVIFKADHDKLGILPHSNVWKNRPQCGYIGSCDFITRRDWWDRHIGAFGKPSQGDCAFLKRMWSHDPRVVWLDRQLAAVQRISNGRPE